MSGPPASLAFGMKANLGQFLHYLLQVLFVGFAVGMTRTVVPALAEEEFGVPEGSFLLMATFVVAFGIVKAAMNFAAGRMADAIGRKNVLVLGWLAAVPVPLLIYFAPDWNWIVAATLLLGVNQGLAWSVTQAAKLDFTRPAERGTVIGFNEFGGYVGVALAGVATAYAAGWLGPRLGLLLFGCAVVLVALAFSLWGVRETLPWARATPDPAGNSGGGERGSAAAPMPSGAWPVFKLVSWRDRRLAALSQAGLVEKFVDALVWVFYPVYLYERGVPLPSIGWIVGIYGLVWGAAQLLTGALSDRFGRHWLNVGGMWICGAGVALMLAGEGVVWWSAMAAVTGLGMALLYPNLSAAVADLSDPAWRGTAIGIYRFWRDLGYAVGALGIGIAASAAGIAASFLFVAASMAASGALLLCFGEETSPRRAPAALPPSGGRAGNRPG